MKKGFYTTLAALAMAFSLHAQTPTVPSVSAPQDIEKRTISREMEKTINGKKWALVLKNDEVASVKINGKILPKSAWTKYQTEIDDLRASAYALDPDVSGVPKDGIIKTQDIQLSDGGNLTPEEKATQHALEDEMLKQGLIATRAYKLILSDKSMILNGKTMPKETMDKYIAIYYTYSGDPKCTGCTFKFQIDKQTEK
jgi:hypothetical protein